MGSGTPAMLEMSDAQPAVQFTTIGALMSPRLVLTPVTLPPAPLPPGPDPPSTLMSRTSVLRIDDAGVDALELVHLGPPVHRAQRRVGVGQREVAPLGEHDVQVQVVGHRLVEGQRAVIEGHSLGREVVGAHDGGVAAGAATSHVALVDHGHVGDAMVLGQVVGRGEAMHPGADDDDVIGVAHLGASPHPWPVASCQAVLDQSGCRVLRGWLPHWLITLPCLALDHAPRQGVDPGAVERLVV